MWPPAVKEKQHIFRKIPSEKERMRHTQQPLLHRKMRMPQDRPSFHSLGGFCSMYSGKFNVQGTTARNLVQLRVLNLQAPGFNLKTSAFCPFFSPKLMDIWNNRFCSGSNTLISILPACPFNAKSLTIAAAANGFRLANNIARPPTMNSQSKITVCRQSKTAFPVIPSCKWVDVVWLCFP